ncbi:MAG: ECF-type sigma factor [Roseateles sp.]|uniref:ECF-type sigma factor n=1 Tax=Roseateles sp. TaxID=1971397 RepID=UPI0032634A31
MSTLPARWHDAPVPDDAIETLIEQVNAGSAGAQDRLFSAAYDELRKLARARLRDGGRNTVLDTTVLVHESYLRFLRSGRLRPDSRRAFFAYASQVMRSVIIDAVRERQAQRRGGDLARLTLDTHICDSTPAGEDEVLKVHEALEALAAAEPRLAKVVEMRYFGGYNDLEIAEALQLADRTVRRDWDKARLLLGVLLGH